MGQVGQFTDVSPLLKKKQKEEAQGILDRLAAQVEPIMKKRNWKVGSLKEMYPKNPNLLGLNVNMTMRIYIRLRHPYDDSKFMNYHSLLDTLLHELVHIVFGPHDSKFHNLWNVLRGECEDLMRKGYTGEGFLGNGQALGQTPSSKYGPVEQPRPSLLPVAFSGKGFRLGEAPKSNPRNILDNYFTTLKRDKNRNGNPAWCGGTDIHSTSISITNLNNRPPVKKSISNNTLAPSRQTSDQRDAGIIKENMIQFILDHEFDQQSWTCEDCKSENPPGLLYCLECNLIRDDVDASPSPTSTNKEEEIKRELDFDHKCPHNLIESKSIIIEDSLIDRKNKKSRLNGTSPNAIPCVPDISKLPLSISEDTPTCTLSDNQHKWICEGCKNANLSELLFCLKCNLIRDDLTSSKMPKATRKQKNIKKELSFDRNYSPKPMESNVNAAEYSSIKKGNINLELSIPTFKLIPSTSNDHNSPFYTNEDKWTCLVCTFINFPLFLVCEICHTVKS